MCNICKPVFDPSRVIKENAMLNIKPELFNIWNFNRNKDIDIYEITKGVKKKVTWICERGHEWEAAVCDMVIKNIGCPYCSCRRVCIENSLATLNPSLASQWHPTLNGDLTPNNFTCGSSKKIWWLCNKGHEWKATIASRNSGQGCPYCAGNLPTNENNFLIKHPKLSNEWDYSKNKIKPEECTPSSARIVWWICPKCKSSYDMSIDIRSRGCNCPYCSGNRVNETNSLASLRPDIAEQWNYERNGELTPHDVTPNSHKNVWWICGTGHEYQKSVKEKLNTSSCPKCPTFRFKIGMNDLWTSEPEIAELLLNPEDGYRVFKSSNEKLNWKCSNCNEVIKDKSVSNVVFRGLKCPNCSDGFSYPEKVMYHLLRELNVDFVWQKTFDWDKNKRYDFYLINYDVIIETHGRQHYEETRIKGGRTLQEEQENDRYKKELAIQNGVNRYIVIDCRNSDISFISNNILNSEIAILFDLTNINFKEIHLKASSSLYLKVLELWNDKKLSIKDISNKLNIGAQTVSSVLTNYNEQGLCVFDSMRGSRLEYKFSIENIYQYDLHGELLRIWNSYDEICNEMQINKYYIHYNCLGKSKSSHGFIWSYTPLNNK